MEAAVLTAALTGPVASKADNPALPTTPDEIAGSAAGAYAAGAAVAHVHLRDERGRPTASLATAERTVAAIQERCPILVQLSTGVGPGVSFADRERLVEARPRMASLNPCSMRFGPFEFSNPPDDVRRLAYRMGELDVKPELEIYDTGHLDAALQLHAEDLLAEPLQFSIVMGVLGGMRADPRDLLTMVDRLPPGAVWQVVAIGRMNRVLTTIGLALGGNGRTGMEDTLKVRRGVLASTNAELVEVLATAARGLDRDVAGVADAARRLALPTQAAA